jgi:hypothetical protein
MIEITLRDYFAGLAMSSLIRNYSVEEEFKAFSQQVKQTGLTPPEIFAKMAYENADAMLKFRNENSSSAIGSTPD